MGGELSHIPDSEEESRNKSENPIGPDAGRDEDGAKFSYWLSGKIVDGSARPSFHRGTVIIEFDATAGHPQIFEGGGEGETAKKFFIEISQEGYDNMMKTTEGVGGIEHIIERAGDEENPIWVTKAALEAKSGKDVA